MAARERAAGPRRRATFLAWRDKLLRVAAALVLLVAGIETWEHRHTDGVGFQNCARQRFRPNRRNDQHIDFAEELKRIDPADEFDRQAFGALLKIFNIISSVPGNAPIPHNTAGAKTP